MKLTTNLGDIELPFVRSHSQALVPTLRVKVPRRFEAWLKKWTEAHFHRSEKKPGRARFYADGMEVCVQCQNAEELKWLDAFTSQAITVKVDSVSVTFGIVARPSRLNEAASMVTPQVGGAARYDQLAAAELITEVTRRGLEAYAAGKPLPKTRLLEILRAHDESKSK